MNGRKFSLSHLPLRCHPLLTFSHCGSLSLPHHLFSSSLLFSFFSSSIMCAQKLPSPWELSSLYFLCCSSSSASSCSSSCLLSSLPSHPLLISLPLVSAGMKFTHAGRESLLPPQRFSFSLFRGRKHLSSLLHLLSLSLSLGLCIASLPPVSCACGGEKNISFAASPSSSLSSLSSFASVSLSSSLALTVVSSLSSPYSFPSHTALLAIHLYSSFSFLSHATISGRERKHERKERRSLFKALLMIGP